MAVIHSAGHRRPKATLSAGSRVKRLEERLTTERDPKVIAAITAQLRAFRPPPPPP